MKIFSLALLIQHFKCFPVEILCNKIKISRCTQIFARYKEKERKPFESGRFYTHIIHMKTEIPLF